MSDLYLQSSDYKLSYSGNRIIVRNAEQTIEHEIGIEQVDNILVFGNSQLTTQLLKQLGYREIGVYFFSENGQFLSFLQPNGLGNFERQELQAKAHFDASFRLTVTKAIALSKVTNQLALLRAYDRDGLLSISDYTRMTGILDNIRDASTIEEVMGYEGRIAKSYFYFLSLIVPEEFRFDGRSRRPAKDLFNALLNFGYSILYSCFTGLIVKNGLSLGFAMIHQAHQHHATLASDLMEEWRPIIVDDTVMGLLGQRAFTQEDFYHSEENGMILTKSGQKVFLQALRERMLEVHDYLSLDAKRYTFLYAADQQVKSLIRAFEALDGTIYQPIRGEELDHGEVF